MLNKEYSALLGSTLETLVVPQYEKFEDSGHWKCLCHLIQIQMRFSYARPRSSYQIFLDLYMSIDITSVPLGDSSNKIIIKYVARKY